MQCFCFISILDNLVQQLINLTPVGLAIDGLLAISGLTIGKLHRHHVNSKIKHKPLRKRDK